MPRISNAKINLIRDIIKKLGYVNIKSVRRWFNLASLEDARKVLHIIAKRDKEIRLVYALTFEKPGALTTFKVEEVLEDKLNMVKEQMSKEGWVLKSIHLIGAKVLESGADD